MEYELKMKIAFGYRQTNIKLEICATCFILNVAFS